MSDATIVVSSPVEATSAGTAAQRAQRARRNRSRQRIKRRPGRLARSSDLRLESEQLTYNVEGVKSIGRLRGTRLKHIDGQILLRQSLRFAIRQPTRARLEQ